METSITIEQLVREVGSDLELSIVAGHAGISRVISVPRIQKPGLALTGYEEQLHDNRLLTLGGTEMEYLASAETEARVLGIETVLASEPACIVVTRQLVCPAELIEQCEARGVPLLVSKLVSADFISRVTKYLQEKLSPACTQHGVLLDVLGVGVLILGKSGIGKSEAALELVMRGHRLVADDVVSIRRVGPNFVLGAGSGLIRHHMEIRGLGIINIQDLYGISAVRDVMRIDLVIELSDWRDDGDYDRLGVEDQVYSILGEELPLLHVPVRPGRNISSLIEVAARNQLLKSMGRHSAREFQSRLDRVIAAGGRREGGEFVE